MSLADYTTENEVRAVLGVSDNEISDTTLALDIYSNVLDSDFESLFSGFSALYQSVLAIVSKTDAEVRFLRNSKTFATFSVAKQLLPALPLFSAKKVGDGKAVMERFEDAYKEVASRVESQYATARNALAASIGEVGSTATTKRSLLFFAVANTAVDPVTGV